MSEIKIDPKRAANSEAPPTNLLNTRGMSVALIAAGAVLGTLGGKVMVDKLIDPNIRPTYADPVTGEAISFNDWLENGVDLARRAAALGNVSAVKDISIRAAIVAESEDLIVPEATKREHEAIYSDALKVAIGNLIVSASKSAERGDTAACGMSLSLVMQYSSKGGIALTEEQSRTIEAARDTAVNKAFEPIRKFARDGDIKATDRALSYIFERIKDHLGVDLAAERSELESTLTAEARAAFMNNSIQEMRWPASNGLIVEVSRIYDNLTRELGGSNSFYGDHNRVTLGDNEQQQLGAHCAETVRNAVNRTGFTVIRGDVTLLEQIKGEILKFCDKHSVTLTPEVTAKLAEDTRVVQLAKDFSAAERALLNNSRGGIIDQSDTQISHILESHRSKMLELDRALARETRNAAARPVQALFDALVTPNDLGENPARTLTDQTNSSIHDNLSRLVIGLGHLATQPTLEGGAEIALYIANHVLPLYPDIEQTLAADSDVNLSPWAIHPSWNGKW